MLRSATTTNFNVSGITKSLATSSIDIIAKTKQLVIKTYDCSRIVCTALHIASFDLLGTAAYKRISTFNLSAIKKMRAYFKADLHKNSKMKLYKQHSVPVQGKQDFTNLLIALGMFTKKKK